MGADLEAVGTEWGEPLTVAVDLLIKQGHRSIAYASTNQPFLASQLGRRRFEALKSALDNIHLTFIEVPRLPDEQYEVALAECLQVCLGNDGRPPFTALIAWGIEDGVAFRAKLADMGLAAPAVLSVVLLGRTDLSHEHADFFETVGCTLADQSEGLYQAITARWADPTRPYGVHLIPVSHRSGASVSVPHAPHGGGHGLTRVTVWTASAADSPT